MIKPLTLAELVVPLHASLHGANVIFERVNTDTRAIKSGDLFVALKGEHFDGHKFIDDACQTGAAAVVVDHVIENLELPQLCVGDTTRALGDIAQVNRQGFSGPLIALTGSCGKTTVKEMLASILAKVGRVHVTQGNLNNHIGVPQTLLAMNDQAEYAVIEMGASAMGEIDYLATLAEPTVALVNNVMAAHLEGFGSQDGVAAEKATIYRRLRPDGTAVVNLDEPYAHGWVAELKVSRPDVTIKTFSSGDQTADVYAADIQLDSSGCYQFLINTEQGQCSVQLPMMGRQNISNALAAVTCGLAVGAELDAIVDGLESVAPVKGRLVALAGSSQSLIIDDTYNANPGSVLAAAQVLLDLQHAGRNTLMVLGDLGELGDDQYEVLVSLGRELQALGVTHLCTQGNNSQIICDGFNETADAVAKGQHFSSQQQLSAYLLTQLTHNTVVLVKGSRGARMENVVQALTLSGEKQ